MDTLQVKLLRNGARLPVRASERAAGLDVCACLDRAITILPGHWEAIPTGIAVRPPPGHEVQVRPRGGLAYKRGITVLNTPGTVDEDYTGEVQVILINCGDAPYIVEHDERIAQLVIAPVHYGHAVLVDELPPTARGEGRFTSTGMQPLADAQILRAQIDLAAPPDWKARCEQAVQRAELAERSRDEYREIFHELSTALNANDRGRDRIDAFAIIAALKQAAGEPRIATATDGTLTVRIEKRAVCETFPYTTKEEA